nr:unnamed protein product [Callosobruchus analis]
MGLSTCGQLPWYRAAGVVFDLPPPGAGSLLTDSPPVLPPLRCTAPMEHRPILVEIGASVPIIRSFPRPRWNFGRANWHLFAEKLDKRLGWIAPKYKNYKRFIGAVISSAKEAIPRGYRKEYVPGWNEHSEQLYNEFVESGDREVGDELLHSLDASRRSKWEDTVQHIDFTRSSRKAWSLLRKLGGGNQIQREGAPLHPNVVAHQIVKTSRAVSDKPTRV